MTEKAEIKISIIVPIYNMQKYLKKCLNSLLLQTLRDIEIICINDGSTDGSLAILQDFAAKDKRIKIVNQKNSGVSAARNAGIKKASGKYVMFVDGDDWIEPETCTECYAKITQDHSDMVVFNFQKIHSQNKIVPSDKLNTIPENPPFFFKNCPSDFFYIMTSAWGKMFRLRKAMTFVINLKKGEDAVFFWEYCLKHNPQISVINKTFYNYLQRGDSTMKDEKITSECEIVKSIKTLAIKSCFKKASHRLQSHILDRFAQSLCYEISHAPIVLSTDYFAQVHNFIDMVSHYPHLEDLRYYQKLQNVVAIYSRKIDLVYLWVDGNDEEWRAQKKYWAEQCGVNPDDVESQAYRYKDNQELRYSLRSAQKFAPWINKIFIITNGQVPEWLDTSHPKIKIIPHEQIMPKSALPTFNASAIETCLANIPELSEYFLFANDDFFFGSPLKPDYFFDAEGKPVIRMVKYNWSLDSIQNTFYKNTVCYSRELINKKMHTSFGKLAGTYNVVPYLKSMYAACAQTFAKEYAYAVHCKFIEKNTVQRTIVTYYTMSKMNIQPKIVNIHIKDKQAEAVLMKLNKVQEILRRLQTTRPKLFCINDHETSADKDREKLQYLLAAFFPVQQAWEKDYGVDGGLLSNGFIFNNIKIPEKKAEPAKKEETAPKSESADEAKK